MFGVHRPTYRGVLWKVHEGLLVRYGADGPPAEPGLWWYVVRNRIEAAGHKLWAARVGSTWDEALVKKVHKLTNREPERVPVGSMMMSGVGPPGAFRPASLGGLHASYDTLAANSLFTDQAGTTAVATSGTDRVRNWTPSYSSGEALAMTDATGGAYWTEGGVKTVRFTSADQQVLTSALSGAAAPSRTAFTCYVVARRTSFSLDNIGYVAFTGDRHAPYFNPNSSIGGLYTQCYLISGDNSGAIGGSPDLSWHVHAFSYSAASGLRAFVDGGETSPTDGTSAPGPQAGAASFTQTGYSIGRMFGFNTEHAYAAVYGYTAQHTPTQVRQMTSYLRSRFSGLLAAASAPVVIWTGASNFMDVATSSGGSNVTGTSVPWKSLQNATKYARHHWAARPSIRTDQTRTRVTDEIARYAANYTGSSVVVCHYAGGNDKDITGGTAAAIYAQLSAYVSDLRAAIPGVKVVLGTYLPRTGFNDTVRAATNALIVANSAGADAVADWAADATIGPNGANGNSTYYQTDGIHLLTAGTTVGYPYWLNAIQGLLP